MSEKRSHQIVAAAIAETARSAAEGRIPPVGARARRMPPAKGRRSSLVVASIARTSRGTRGGDRTWALTD